MSKLTLRIEHSVASPRKGSLRLMLLSDGALTAECASTLDFELSAADAEAIRWYWEDYLDYPAGDARLSVERVQRRLSEIGEPLFRQTFAGKHAARLWELVSPCLVDVRFQIHSPTTDDCPALPWELLRDAVSGRLPAAECRGFVRRPAFAPAEVLFKPDRAPRLRIRAVLCRPLRLGKMSFRPAFRELIRRFPTHGIEWDILRPPTFGKLTSALLEAESFGEPCHVLHFEGAALAADLSASNEAASVAQPRRHANQEAKTGRRGYLALDHAQDSSRLRLVDAASLAEAMGEARTPIAFFRTVASCPTTTRLHRRLRSGRRCWRVSIA